MSTMHIKRCWTKTDVLIDRNVKIQDSFPHSTIQTIMNWVRRIWEASWCWGWWTRSPWWSRGDVSASRSVRHSCVSILSHQSKEFCYSNPTGKTKMNTVLIYIIFFLRKCVCVGGGVQTSMSIGMGMCIHTYQRESRGQLSPMPSLYKMQSKKF